MSNRKLLMRFRFASDKIGNKLPRLIALLSKLIKDKDKVKTKTRQCQDIDKDKVKTKTKTKAGFS